MARVLDGSPVPRHTVFILADGTFVVQWDENHVQDLVSGRYRKYDNKDFGHSITVYELNQLKTAGLVEHYNDQFVWLYALPVQGRYAHEYYTPTRSRSFYLNTTLPEARLAEVEQGLKALALDGDFLARVRGSLIAVLGKNGAPFRQLKDAERAQKVLIARAPELFRYTAIAFVETSDAPYSPSVEQSPGPLDLGTIINSQSDTSVTSGKQVLVVTSSEEEQVAMQGLFSDMEMAVIIASTGAEGIRMVEDHSPDVMLMDMALPDMHPWEVLAKIKEIGAFQTMPKIMLANHQSTPDDQAFALTVGKVDGYLVRPVSMAQLRQAVWLALKHRQDSGS